VEEEAIIRQLQELPLSVSGPKKTIVMEKQRGLQYEGL
jgi:hypothetical protein